MENTSPPSAPITPTPVIPEVPVVPPKDKVFTKALIGVILFAVVLIIILTTIGINLLITKWQNSPVVVPQPPETKPATQSAVPKISKLSSDSATLLLRSDINDLGSQIDSVDLVEPQLSPPNIDLNINIPSGR